MQFTATIFDQRYGSLDFRMDNFRDKMVTLQ